MLLQIFRKNSSAFSGDQQTACQSIKPPCAQTEAQILKRRDERGKGEPQFEAGKRVHIGTEDRYAIHLILPFVGR